MTEGLTQTQERKLWASIMNGNDHSIKWNEIFSAFVTLGVDRQMTALKHVPVRDFIEIGRVHDAASKVRHADIESHNNKQKDIAKIKEQMKESGVSFEELRGIRTLEEPVTKKKYKVSGNRFSVDDLFNVILESEENGIFKESATALSKRLDIGVSTVYHRLSSLVEDGRLVNLGREGYQVIRK